MPTSIIKPSKSEVFAFAVKKGARHYYDNDVKALVPEWWARQTLRLLDRETKMLPLVNRDYNDMFAEAGDVVNLNKDGSFTAKRKEQGQSIKFQDVKSTKDTVRLNQQLHVSYLLDDQDRRRTFADLVARYMVRSAVALGIGVDAVCHGEVYQFTGSAAGKLGTTLTDDAFLELNEIFNRNNVPHGGRNVVVGASSERDILGITRFIEASTIGDGRAIRTGQIGHIRGFDIILSNGSPEIAAGNDTYVGAVNEAGGYAAGSTTITVDGFLSESVTAGSWCTIAGDMRPRRIASRTVTTGDTVEIVLETGIESAVLNDAVITVYRPFKVNQASATILGQASGYDFQSGEDIEIDGYTNFPMLGQGVTIGATGTDYYTIMGVSEDDDTITLCRPLDVGVLNDVDIFPMPMGNYNFAFIRDALTFVNRPLMPPDPGTGVQSYTASYKGVAIRVTLGYDMLKEQMRITLSTLCGVKTLDTDMGAVLMS